MSHHKNPNLAIVAEHGPPEVTGLALLEGAQKNPIEGWNIEVANKLAVDAGVRLIDHNLAAVFDDRADPKSDVYEFRRAGELLDLARQHKTVLSIHDRPDADGEYAMLGMNFDPRLLGIVALLGMKRIILYPHGNMLINRAPNVVLLDFCRGDKEGHPSLVQDNVTRLRHCLRRIAGDDVPVAQPSDFQFYKLEREIHYLEAVALGLLKNEVDLLPFEPIPEETVQKLALPPGEECVAEYWNGINSSNGEWYGGVLRKLVEPPHLA